MDHSRLPDEAEFRHFVDEYRARCLWFLRPGYYPATLDERAEVLRLIAQRGDVSAFKRAAEFRRWLLRPSSETSSVS